MKTSKKNIVLITAIIVVLAAVAYFGIGNTVKSVRQMRYGIDINGGIEAVFEADSLDRKPTAKELESAKLVIESRLDDENIDDREVTVDNQNGLIIVRFPWKSDEKQYDPEKAISELGDMAELTFRDPDGNVMVQGRDIKSSAPRSVRTNGKTEYVVELEFTDEGASKFQKATAALIGQKMGIYMDGRLISDPVVEAEISGGQAVINGMADYNEAKTLSDRINSGALPFSMSTTNFSTISPSLGQNSLHIMIIAGLIAFAAVCLFMIIFYRLPGVIACLTLLLQMTLQLLAISIPQYTLTLPGIAGIILSLGMAVDANIIISERISEEIAKGQTLISAVKTGYSRALSSVLDGNITTAVVAVILMIFGSGTMLSFGYTLLTGTVINCLVGVQISKIMLASALQYDALNDPKFFRPKKARPAVRFYENRKVCAIISGTLLVIGIAALLLRGVKLDTQFAGGTVLAYSISGEADTDKISNAVHTQTDRPVTVQITDSKTDNVKKLVVTLAGNGGISPEIQQNITDKIGEVTGQKDLEASQSFSVEPYIGALALKNAVIAILLSFVFITLYVWIRFSVLSGLSAGITALIALVHDVAVVFFSFVLFGIPIGDAFVAVVLTIIGFSINDTIVVYDRIRENRNIQETLDIPQLVNISVTQVMTRSINTSVTTAMCVLVILAASIIFGISSIYQFALPMLFGLISGCYSSICIASVLWAMWKSRKMPASI